MSFKHYQKDESHLFFGVNVHGNAQMRYSAFAKRVGPESVTIGRCVITVCVQFGPWWLPKSRETFVAVFPGEKFALALTCFMKQAFDTQYRISPEMVQHVSNDFDAFSQMIYRQMKELPCKPQD